MTVCYTYFGNWFTVSLDLTSTSDFILSSKNFIKLLNISFFPQVDYLIWPYFTRLATYLPLSKVFAEFIRHDLFFLSRDHLVSYFAPGARIFVFHSLCGFATRSSAPQQNRPFCKVVIRPRL